MTQKRIFNLPIGPGQYTEQSERGAMGRWYTMDKVRFRKGLAEKIGGWVQLQPQFLGTARRLLDWSSLDAKRWAAIGTDVKLYLWQDGNPPTLYDITPLRRTVALVNPFETFAASTNVNVTDPSHGAQSGDYVTFMGATLFDNVLIDGEYVINVIIDQDTYQITSTTTATSGVAGGGGNVTAEYQISTGAASVVTATGYGTGPWSREGWGNARTGSQLQIGIRTWSLDTWGEDLLACPRGGEIYWWDRTGGTGQRAIPLTDLGGDAPISNQAMLVSTRDRHVLALGAYDFFNSAFDPLLIRWCSTEDLNDWVPTSTNTSGDLRLYAGSKIVTGVRSRLETIIFTDVSVHTLPFVGGFEVFGLNIVGENVSILGPNAAIPIDHRVLFMAESDFFIYDGVVKVLPCDVRNFVYDNLNTIQRDKVYGGLNREFNECWWFYPSFDPDCWVQQDFSLGLPPGYSQANSSTAVGDPNFNDVVLLAKFEGADGATSYTELSNEGASATFVDNAQIDTGVTPAFGTGSLQLDGTGDEVTFADIAAYDLGTGDFTIEGWIRLDTLPPDNGSSFAPNYTIFSLWGSTGAEQAVNFVMRQDTFGFRVGLETRNSNENSGTFTFAINTWYHWAITRETATDNIRLYFDGNYRVGDFGANTGVNLDRTGSEPLRLGSLDGSDADTFVPGRIDNVRITKNVAYYTGTGSYTVPVTDFPESAGGAQDTGYLYSFNGNGFTEVQATADNNYEHDYFLTNDEPILTPTEAEYAVELDVNPDIGAGTGRAGVCCLRTDLTGTPATDADDAQQLMFELNYDDDRVEVWKKTAAGVAAPANQGANTADFTTVTGSAMALGTKYVLTIQFDTPTVTCFVDGNQAFQFDLDATELTQFTSGTAGLHQVPGNQDDLYRFFNFASGPVGCLTAADFDISPIEVNRYVAFNYEEGSWITGKLARTAWADRSPLLEKAYAAGTDGYLYQHETGTDDNGVALAAFIESFDMEIPEAGEELMHVDQLIPDFLTLEGSVTVNLTGRKYPQDPNRISKGPYTVQTGTRKLSTRMRARQVAIRVSSSDTGDRWRMGNWRGRAGPHGRRG